MSTRAFSELRSLLPHQPLPNRPHHPRQVVQKLSFGASQLSGHLSAFSCAILICSRRAAEQKNAAAHARPAGTRAAGVGGSTNTMLKLYTDDVGQGFKVYISCKSSNIDVQGSCCRDGIKSGFYRICVCVTVCPFKTKLKGSISAKLMKKWSS